MTVLDLSQLLVVYFPLCWFFILLSYGIFVFQEAKERDAENEDSGVKESESAGGSMEVTEVSEVS